MSENEENKENISTISSLNPQSKKSVQLSSRIAISSNIKSALNGNVTPSQSLQSQSDEDVDITEKRGKSESRKFSENISQTTSASSMRSRGSNKSATVRSSVSSAESEIIASSNTSRFSDASKAWKLLATKVTAQLKVHPLDKCKNPQQIVHIVDDLERKLKHLQVENKVFHRFLENNEPEAIEELLKKSAPSNASSRRTSVVFVRKMSRKSIASLFNFGSRSGSDTQTPRIETKINFSQRSDLVAKDLELVENHLEQLRKKTKAIKHRLLAKFEEMETRQEELEKSSNNFEQFKQMAENGQIISLEKYVRFMQEWFKKTGVTIDKLRLRFSTLKVQYHKLSGTYAHKKSLGENLSEIDFDQMRLANIHLAEKIQERTRLLRELKKMTAENNLKLVYQRKTLQDKISVQNELSGALKGFEMEITRADDEISNTYETLDKVKMKFEKIDRFVAKHEAPDVLDYLTKKVEIEKLRKQWKMWERRKRMRKEALKIEVAKKKRVLGCERLDFSWFA